MRPRHPDISFAGNLREATGQLGIVWSQSIRERVCAAQPVRPTVEQELVSINGECSKAKLHLVTVNDLFPLSKPDFEVVQIGILRSPQFRTHLRGGNSQLL